MAYTISLTVMTLIFTSPVMALTKPQPHAIRLSTIAPVSLKTIEDYLNSFRTLKANFRQINPNGTMATGTLYLWRPGRMRLSYDQPNVSQPALQRVIVADGDSFFDHNPAMDETTEIPVDATPASLIMREHIDFGDDIKVVHNQMKHGLQAITLTKRHDSDTGTLTLLFNPVPLTLLEWEIVDAQQLRTRVILDNIETGIVFKADLFDTNF